MRRALRKRRVFDFVPSYLNFFKIVGHRKYRNLNYSAFRQKFPKLWTSVAHSFLQQVAPNKSWAHPKATTLPRIYKVEMEHASLLFYLAKPQSGGVLGCDLRHCSTSEPFDFRRFVEACGAYSQYPAWSRCCRSADVPRADRGARRLITLAAWL